MENLTKLQAEILGNQVIVLLNLKMKNGKVDTGWGSKTALGLGASIALLLNDVVSNRG